VHDLPTEREWTSQGLHYGAKGPLKRPARSGKCRHSSDGDALIRVGSPTLRSYSFALGSSVRVERPRRVWKRHPTGRLHDRHRAILLPRRFIADQRVPAAQTPLCDRNGMPIKDQHRNVLRRGLDRGPATKGSKAQARGCQQAPGHGMSLAHKLILALAVGARSLDRSGPVSRSGKSVPFRARAYPTDIV
jgi:hypothetical protein